MFKMKLQKRQVQMDKQNIRIKLRAYDNKVLDQSTEEIVNKYLSFSQQKVEEFVGERVWEQDSLPGNKHIKLKSIRTKGAYFISI